MAVRNHIHLCPDDPAFALVTLVQLTLEASAGRGDDQFRASMAEFQRSVQEVETRAGQVVAERVEEAAGHFASELQLELSVAGRKIGDGLVRSVNVQNRSACGPQKLNPGALHRTKSQLLGERACDIVTDVTET